MRKIVLLLSVATVMVAVFGVVPTAATKKHRREDGGGGMTTSADERGNDISVGDTNKLASASAVEYDGDKRFPVRYSSADESAAAAVPAEPQPKTKKQPSKQHNAKLLNRLGMKRVRTSGGSNNPTHHRKRLASQSRSKYAAVGGDGKGGSDSQMFIVKLPPHSHFYDDASPAAVHQRLQQQQHQQHHHNNNLQHQYQQVPYKNLNTVPVGFVSNGKPAKVYHWNLPTIKHALQGRYKNGGGGGGNDYLQAGDFELPSSAGSKIVPRRTLYYKPRANGKPVKKSFVNNGKPNGFYVVSGKNANAAAAVPQYHKIVKAYYGDD